MTAEELLTLDLKHMRTELVQGELRVREPAGYRHGDVAMRLAVAIANHVYSNGLGRVFAAETGFTLSRDPDTVRAADVAFLSNARIPDSPPRGFADLAPDLVVEVLSPDDRPGELLSKIADWLTAGTRLVWVVDPARASSRVYRADGVDSVLDGDDVFDGEDVLPGFTFPIAAAFA